MPLTRSFKETVQARARRDKAFREALLIEGIDALLAGEIDTGKAILRDYVNATVGFDKLSKQTGSSPKSLMRMLGPKGNPKARNLFSIIHGLQKSSGVHLRVQVGR
jgi:DNA-binding phage protein